MVDLEALSERAKELDAADNLSSFREEFYIPENENGEPQIYFVGNSLGLQPKTTQSYVAAELDIWRQHGVAGHFHGDHPWVSYHECLTPTMADIVGATSEEVVVMNSLTANLHLMMATFFRPEGRRKKILLEEHAFPSDHYAIASQLRWWNLDPEREMVNLSPDADQKLISTDKILQAIEYYGDELAMVLLPGIQYYTGQRFDMQAITAAAHQFEIPVGFDLAHAAGNIELSLHDWDVDFAVWCNYKYLNGGPGTVGGCFVHQRHAKDIQKPRLAGWWGHDKQTRFLMQNQFQAIPSVEGWQLSNPPILALAAIRASLDVFERATVAKLVEKSNRLTGFFIDCLDAMLAERIEIITPREPDHRGCQLSLSVNSIDQTGKKVYQRLTEAGICTDWREPNVIRAAPVPLYNTFSDVFRFCQHLRDVLDE